MDDLERWLTLARAPGLHAGQLADYLAQGGSPDALPAEPRAALEALGLGGATIKALKQPDAEGLDADECWLEGDARRGLVTWASSAYPPLLAAIPDPPLVLFVEGAATPLSLPQLAIVGSRSPTPIGRDTATRFAAHFARAGFAVTSGLALGIDAASHRGALEADGRTVAVLGCGLDTVYPRENAALAREILERSGTLVSDLPTGTPPLKHHFPRRNRLISGLATGTLVVEAALHSGSLITARLAGEQGREVFAIPGSIHSPLSRGCHRLIRQGAKLVESADDVFAELGPLLAGLQLASRTEPSDAQQDFVEKLDKDHEILLDALGFEPASVDVLTARTGLTADTVASMLLILELDGRVQQQPGGRFSRRLPGKV